VFLKGIEIVALTFLAAWNYGRAGTLKGVKETWLRTYVPVKALIWWGTYPFISEKSRYFFKIATRILGWEVHLPQTLDLFIWRKNERRIQGAYWKRCNFSTSKPM